VRLRPRLALAVVAAALPLAGAVVWLTYDLERQRVEQVLREFAVTRMEAGGRERCEADPAVFPRPPRRDPSGGARDGTRPPPPPPVPSLSGGEEPSVGRQPGPTRPDVAPPPPPLPEGRPRTRFWAYGADLASANPDAPPPPTDLAAEVRGGADVASRRYDGPEGVGHEALVRMAWSGGPCDFVLVRRVAQEAERAALEPWWAGALVAAGVLVAVLLAAGPVVRRIRRLEADVRRSASATYDAAVEISGEDEVTALARAFNDAAAEVRSRVDDLHDRERTLREFVANTTHDLMTPLTVLQGHLDALAAAVEHGDPDAREAARDALREVDYTTSLVANLATAAKLEAGPGGAAREAVDLNELVERVAARFRPVARVQGIELNHAVPEEALATRGDVTLIEQAVSNVVQNAVRYNRSGGHVAIVLRAGSAGRFGLRVVDDGPGVAKEELARLSDRGERGDLARTRAPGGRGLGLDIARSVCERHGLGLEFARSEHGGLAVTFDGSIAG
jgi:signal transduction histidine kinase